MSNSISTLVQTGLAKYNKSKLIHICIHNDFSTKKRHGIKNYYSISVYWNIVISFSASNCNVNHLNVTSDN